MLIKEQFNKKLLVEGNNDQHVIWALCEKLSIFESFDVIDCNGISQIIEQIPIRFKQSGIETIGLIIDADIDIKQRWDSISSIINNLGVKLPSLPPPEGLISQVGKIRFGIWIMPNNNLNGMLEDFISFLIPEGDKLIPIVNDTLNSIESNGLNKYKLIHKPKATIHTWLAWQEDPATPMGQAITKKYLTTDHGTCIKLVSWLDKLYNS
jgi:hypothetical protein